MRMRRYAIGRTRFMITSLTAHANRIVVGDCRDGILFFSYLEVGFIYLYALVLYQNDLNMKHVQKDQVSKGRQTLIQYEVLILMTYS